MRHAVQQWQSQRRYTRDGGFTIVELIIVIIVIAILALIVITTYNGVQQKAKNAKTIAAVEAWAKGLHLYNADTDTWPGGPGYGSCIGDADTYDGAGDCWNGSFTVNSSFVDAIKPYLGGGSVPQPDTTNVNPAGTQYRGAFYYVSPSFGPEIRLMLTGVTSCPKIGGLTQIGTGFWSNGVSCEKQLNP